MKFTGSTLSIVALVAGGASPALSSAGSANYLRLLNQSQDLPPVDGYQPLSHSSAIPAVQMLPSDVKNKDAVRKRIRYGPYVVPASNETTLDTMTTMEKGSLQFLKKVDPVCLDCVVLRGHTAVEYEDGTHANVDTGIYLHHAVMLNFAKKERMINCAGFGNMLNPKGPGLFIGGASEGAASVEGGNMYSTPDGSFKSGYHVAPTDTFGMWGEIMNYAPVRKTVYLVTDADYIPSRPADYLDTHTMPFTATSCATGPFVKPPSKQYSLKSKAWQIPSTGYIVNMKGHMHDGGDSVQVSLNYKMVCNSLASYGSSKEYQTNETLSDGTKWATLSDMSMCADPIAVTKGDNITIVANYDTNKHPMRMSTSKQEEAVMGIAVFQMAFPAGFVIP
jgi:hypothetical protein